jgi:hypothetical protein
MNRQKTEQTTRLTFAYIKMNTEGKNALDQMVGQLAEVHKVNSESSLTPDKGKKQPKRVRR